jgi:hypothetical protein
VIVIGSLVVFVTAGLAFASALPNLPAYEQQFQTQLSQTSGFFTQRGIDTSALSDAISKATQVALAILVGVASGVAFGCIGFGPVQSLIDER